MESSPLMTWAFATWIELRWAVRSRALWLPVCRDAIAAGLWARSLKGEGGKLRVTAPLELISVSTQREAGSGPGTLMASRVSERCRETLEGK